MKYAEHLGNNMQHYRMFTGQDFSKMMGQGFSVHTFWNVLQIRGSVLTSGETQLLHKSQICVNLVSQ